MSINDQEPQWYADLTAKQLIEVLEQRSNPRFGKITSSVFTTKCYLTNKMYPDDTGICDKQVLGTFSGYPYNCISFHEENEWLVPCLQQLYWVRNNIIPHQPRAHNLPKIVKIKRTNGDIYDAVVNDCDYGIKIRKSKTLNDQYEKFYVRVFWCDATPVLDKSKVDEYHNMSSFKDIPIENILNVNPQLAEKPIQLTFTLLKEEAHMNEVQREVIQYCNDAMKLWIETELEEIIKNNAEYVKIEYNIV